MNLITNYQFIFSGETLRGLILTVIGVVVLTLYRTDLNAVADWKTYAISLGIAALQAGVAFIFGKIPPSKPVT